MATKKTTKAAVNVFKNAGVSMNSKKSLDQLGKIFEDVFSGISTKQGAQVAKDDKSKCFSCEDPDCAVCEDASDYLGAIIECKAIFHRLDVILALAVDQMTEDTVDLKRSINLIQETRNLVRDGGIVIADTGLQL